MRLQVLLQSLLFTGSFALLLITPAWSQEVKITEVETENVQDQINNQAINITITKIPRLNQIDFGSKSVQWLAQSPPPSSSPAAEIIEVTGVQVNPTQKGLDIIFQTTKGDQLQVSGRNEGNAYIADIPNTQLRLPSGNVFRQEKPIIGITEVTVTNQDANTIRVTVTGEAGVPTVELFDSDQGLIFEVAAPAPSVQQPEQQPQTPTPAPAQPESQIQPEQPSAESEEPIELVVTGEQDGYSVPNASTATRTDTPLRDIPQSIQVIPQQVLKDQQVTRISDAVRNVSGVTPQKGYGDATDFYTIRGFNSSRTLRNGFNVRAARGGTSTFTSPSSVERVEVLKGPASVLYGQLEPGGLVNLVTKKPLSDPYYAAEFTAGSYSFYSPSIDISGPVTSDKKLLYRLNASYQNFGSFIDFVNGENLSVVPVISYQIGDRTDLTFEYEYSRSEQVFNDGLPIDPISFELPISRNLNNPDDTFDNTTNSLNLALEHGFNDNITIRTAFGASFSEGRTLAYRLFDFNPETNEVLRAFRDSPDYGNDYSWQTDLIAKFDTGTVKHELLAGFELAFNRSGFDTRDSEDAFINVLDPAYDTPIPPAFSSFKGENTSNIVGLYLQDQITLLPNLKLLVGGRYDFARAESDLTQQFVGEATSSSSDEFYSEAFSPRVGLVYQPIAPISLYASYSRSFLPNNARTFGGEIIEPTRGTQFEVGVKADLGRLSATLAAYEITKTNILTNDLANPNFSVGIGEVRSRGIELDISGEILPGWNIIASSFINDAVVTKNNQDTNFPIDDTLVNAPRHGASLWTSYEIQAGDLQGLGFGVGVFFIGDREAELPNDLVLPSYVRADASIFYKRDSWRVGLNFKNISDTRYYESSQNSGLIYPGTPFTVLGTISVQF
jgi:iron complex outermembrane recepter protein